MTRLQAARKLCDFGGIQTRFAGIEKMNGSDHSFKCILTWTNDEGFEATFKSDQIGRFYQVKVTAYQVLAFIRKNYPRSPCKECGSSADANGQCLCDTFAGILRDVVPDTQPNPIN